VPWEDQIVAVDVSSEALPAAQQLVASVQAAMSPAQPG
jgi:hypothetical protein